MRSHSLTAALLLGLLFPTVAWGHATGENYVWLNVEGSGVETRLEGRFEIRVVDLERRFGLDLPADREAAKETVASSAGPIERYLRQSFSIVSNGMEIPYEFTGIDLVEAGDLGGFAQFFYRTARAEIPDRLEIRNRVLLDDDRFHRSLLCIQYDRRNGSDYGEEFTALVFSRSNSDQVLDLANLRGLLRVRDFVWQGMLHIWAGIDHVLFLIALLLTAVLMRKEERADGVPSTATSRSAWQPVTGFREALWNVAKIVTLFTVAHSLTLSLAALDLVRLPGRLVESVIALSIVLIALNNIFPRLREGSWIVIFFFGLFHGLGFASVMGDLPFRMANLVQVVLAFNVGVEVGQVAIVAAVFPLLFLLRKSSIYRPAVLAGGSIAISLVATYWFVTRALGIQS